MVQMNCFGKILRGTCEESFHVTFLAVVFFSFTFWRTHLVFCFWECNLLTHYRWCWVGEGGWLKKKNEKGQWLSIFSRNRRYNSLEREIKNPKRINSLIFTCRYTTVQLQQERKDIPSTKERQLKWQLMSEHQQQKLENNERFLKYWY